MIQLMKPIVHQIYANNPLRNFNYLVEGKNGYVIIDPYDSDQVIKQLGESANVLGIINTHEHHDHIRGNAALKSKYQCKVFCHANALQVIPEADNALGEGDQIDLGDNWFLETIDTPGHTFSHLCLFLKNADVTHAVFTGDTLFNAGVGNCHNGGDPKVLFETIRDHFKDLDDSVVVYPGHDYLRNNLAFTIDREPSNKVAHDWLGRHQRIDQNQEFWLTKMKDERLINTFLRLDKPSVVDNLPIRVQDEKSVFITLRELRNNW